MIAFSRLLWGFGKAIVNKGLRDLAGRVPFVGPFAGLAIDVCADTYKYYHEDSQDEDIARAIPKDMEQLAQADPAQVEAQARQIADQVLVGRPPPEREALAGTLALVPAQIRKTFTRKEDLTGKTRPPAFLVRGPEDLLSILPTRPPRFKEGDPLPNDPKWTLDKRLDAGGFGEVWKVRHATLKNRFGAVKFCLDPAAQERLIKHEARVINQVMQIKNDNIVRLEEVDFNPSAPWLRYEFIDGGNLLTAEPLPTDVGRRAAWTRNMVLPLARAIGACHLVHPPVVHRDLKPANVLIDRVYGHDGKQKGRPKITDFGISEIIAQQALDQAKQETSCHASFATPTILRGSYTEMYASQQQKAGLPAAPTDDVYALGVMWFQFLMGDYFLPPGRDYREDLAELGLCDELVGVLAKCVADKAERRWTNAKVLAEQIERLPANLLKVELTFLSAEAKEEKNVNLVPRGESSNPAGMHPNTLGTAIDRKLGNPKEQSTVNEKEQPDEKAFLAALKESRGSDEENVARSLLEWAKNCSLRIRWYKNGSPGFLVEWKGKIHYLIWFGLSGKIEVLFEYMKDGSLPFANEKKREEFRSQLNLIPGVEIPPDALGKRPKIFLTTLTQKNSLEQFLKVLDWFVQEIKAS